MPANNPGSAANFQVPILMADAHGLVSTQKIIPIVAPFSGRLTSVVVTDTTLVAASDTDYIDVTVTNKGTDASGTAVMATGTTKAASMNGVAADVAKAVPLSATFANTLFSAGDLIYVDVTFSGSGAFTNGAVQVFGVSGAY